MRESGELTEALAVERGPRYLTRRAIAVKFDLSERYLERLAVEGGGPPFVRVGRAVRYPEDLADQWARSKIVSK